MDKFDNNVPIIRGQRVILRLPNKSDIYSIIKYYLDNKVHLEQFEPIRPDNFYTIDFWENDIKNRLKEYQEDKSLRMFIFDRNDNSTIIGVVNFNQIIRGAFHACYLGYSIAGDKQGEGYMTESLQYAIDFAFEQLNLHRIMANYMPHNRKSGNVLRRLGFTVEGYARDYLFINGKWEDHILTSLTNTRWSLH